MSEPDAMICQHNKRLSECEFCVPLIEDAVRRALQPLGDFTVLAATPSEPSEAPEPSKMGGSISTDKRVLLGRPPFAIEDWQPVSDDVREQAAQAVWAAFSHVGTWGDASAFGKQQCRSAVDAVLAVLRAGRSEGDETNG